MVSNFIRCMSCVSGDRVLTPMRRMEQHLEEVDNRVRELVARAQDGSATHRTTQVLDWIVRSMLNPQESSAKIEEHDVRLGIDRSKLDAHEQRLALSSEKLDRAMKVAAGGACHDELQEMRDRAKLSVIDVVVWGTWEGLIVFFCVTEETCCRSVGSKLVDTTALCITVPR